MQGSALSSRQLLCSGRLALLSRADSLARVPSPPPLPGNRAPLGIYVHAGWLEDPSRSESLKRFINYALEHENVWFATMSQVIRWQKDPKPASEVNLGCKKPTDMWFPSGDFCKAITCVNGGCRGRGLGEKGSERAAPAPRLVGSQPPTTAAAPSLYSQR